MVVLLTTASLEGQHLAKSFFNTGLLGAAGASAPSDDQFNRVSFLSHFDGANNGVNNAFDDGSANNYTVTAAGNVTQGSFGPFARPDGEWGCEFSANGDTLNLGSSTDFDFAGDFSIEMFLMDSATDGIVFANHKQGVNTGYYFFNRPARLALHNEGDGFNLGNDNIQPVGVWYHLVISRQSGSMRVFIDGVLKAVVSNSSAITSSIHDFMIGGTTNSSGNLDFTCNAKVSNFRIVNGSCATAYQTSSTTIGATIFTVPTGPLTAETNTKLLTCQSNRFVDNSGSAHTATPTGNAAVTAFGPFLTSSVYDPAVNGASAYFDGSGDALRVSDTASLRIGTGQYTIECWFWFDVLTGDLSGIFAKRDGGSDYWRILATSSGVNFRINSDVVSDSTVVNKKCWNHIAITRDSNNDNRIYVNGSLINTISSSVNISNTGTVRLGEYEADTGPMTGYICDARIVIGTAVYTGSSLTLPTAPLAVTDSNTKLLLNMADGQAIDSAAQNNLTLAGNAKLSTGQAKFGNTSMVFDGTGDYFTLPSSSFKPFGTGDFTIECFARFDAINGKGLFQLGASYLPSAVTGPAVFASIATNNPWRIYYGTSEADASVSPSADTWYHVAYVRSSGVTKLYVDGTSVISQNDTTNYTNTFFVIGGGYSSSFLMDGYIDEFRISHMARYTSNFTAPTAAFADKGQET